uniref:F-box domain-containing protein n=1 Tax=Oryza glumipatula TaxID=40148 RepID=A0A0D9ZLU5_9ORYZ
MRRERDATQIPENPMEGIPQTAAAAAAAAAEASEPPRKRARVDGGGGGAGEEEEDRLSDLPDCLLEDILAHLGSRQAVQTSVLSRRWRNLWRGVRVVVIDVGSFRLPGADGDPPRFRLDRIEDFADGVLSPSLHPGAARELDALRMRLDEDAVTTNFQRWIRRALWRRPATVDLYYLPRRSFSWPPAVPLTPVTAVSRLKTLRIFGLRPTVVFGADEFPALEDLHIERCSYAHGTIASPTLKRLALVSPINGCFVREQRLTAPGLTSLRLVLPYSREEGVRVITDAPLTSLVDASITIVDTDPGDPRNRRVNQFKVDFLVAISNLLGRLTSVRNLDLTGLNATALLDNKSQEFPMFPYLTTLLLNECDIGYKYHVLRSILQNAPNLEQLRLHNCKFVGKSRRKAGQTQSKEKTSKCSSSTLSSACSSLKSVEIKHPRGEPSHDLLHEFLKEIPHNQWRKRSIDEETISIELNRK